MSLPPTLWVSRLTTPGAGAFAVMFGLNAFGRALLTAALPVQTLRIMGSDEGVSTLFLVGSVVALCFSFLIPRLAGWMGRARLCSLAILLIAGSAGLFLLDALTTQVLGFVVRACGTVILYAGLSLFIMDHIPRRDLGRTEPLRMLSVGIAWTTGPLAGVQIEALWGPWAPFLASAAVGVLMLAYFWGLRLSRLPIVRPARPRRFAAPLANLGVFLAQPRMVLAWAHAIGRGIFWASFAIYTPLYALETGLGADTGGRIVSLGAGFMLLMPLWGWLARRAGIRRVSLIAFPLGGTSLIAAGLLSAWPWLGALCIVGGACCMTVVDGYGNSLFYRACRPAQRPAMTPIFAMHRDLSEIAQAGTFAVLLIFLPVQAVFFALGCVLLALGLLATRIHERL